MEPKRDRRKIWWAVVASLFVHFIVAYALASFGGVFAPRPPEEEPTSQLTFVDLPAPAEPAPAPNPRFIETDPAKESAEAPQEKTFESNANSIAASEKPAAGDAPIPTQDGKERPFMDLETRAYSLPVEGEKAQPRPESKEASALSTPVPPAPSATPTATLPPKTTPTPMPVTTPEPEQFAMLTATPPPPIAPEEAQPSPAPGIAATAPPPVPRPRPALPSSSFQSEKQATRLTGRISTRGPSAVNAVGTPLGRYQKAVSDAIGSRWYYYMKSRIDLVSLGTAHVEAEVDPTGKIQKLRVLSNDSNEAFANICLQSFQEAHLPPIPPDLVATLPEGRMPVDIFFTTYSN